MNNLVRTSKIEIPHYSKKYEIFSTDLKVPNDYVVLQCVCTASVLTSNIEENDYKDISTLISYSWTINGIVKVSLVEDELFGFGRYVDIIAVLTKI